MREERVSEVLFRENGIGLHGKRGKMGNEGRKEGFVRKIFLKLRGFGSD